MNELEPSFFFSHVVPLHYPFTPRFIAANRIDGCTHHARVGVPPECSLLVSTAVVRMLQPLPCVYLLVAARHQSVTNFFFFSPMEVMHHFFSPTKPRGGDSTPKELGVPIDVSGKHRVLTVVHVML